MEYLLDTSALITYLADEKGSNIVAKLIKNSCLSFITLTEIYYIILKRKGEAEADKIYGIIKSWNLPVLLPDEKIILITGKLKATLGLSLADSYNASFALDRNLTLVAKDKDYNILKNQIKLLQLST